MANVLSIQKVILSLGTCIALVAFVLIPLAASAQEVVGSDSGTTTATSTDSQIPLIVASPYTTESLSDDVVYGDFVVGPGKIEVEIKPGQSKIVEMTVTNRTGGPRTFKIGYEDAEGSSDPTQTLVLLGNDRGPYSMKDYVSVPHQSFVLGHSERARIPVTITLPADAEPGGLYGSVLVETVASQAGGDAGDGTASKSAIVARIGTLFFITIPGDIAREGEVTQFATLGEKKFYQQGPIPFGVLFENTGSIHLRPSAEVRITNLFGEEVGYVELEPWFVLPKASRLREFTWNRDVLFGRYVATAHITRGYDAPIDTLTYSFWVLPWKPLLGIFVALFLFFFILRGFFKNFEFRRKT